MDAEEARILAAKFHAFLIESIQYRHHENFTDQIEFLKTAVRVFEKYEFGEEQEK